MRKFLFALVSLVVFSAVVGVTLTGCDSEKKQESSASEPAPLKSQQEDGQEVITVTGEVTDGSANMVIIETEDGTSKEFNYDSDEYAPGDLYDWDLDDNNKIKVSYVKSKKGDVEVDSVIRIEKAE